MNAAEFGQLIKALRQNSFDEGGEKLTRQKLSEAVKMTLQQLGRLERGEQKIIDAQNLSMLAKSLNLTNLEEREFLEVAANLSDKGAADSVSPEISLDEVLNILQQLHVPAYVTDVYCDVVAMNAISLALQGISANLQSYLGTLPIGYNCLYNIYFSQPHFMELLGENEWKESAYMAMLYFRRITLPYRHTAYFKYVLKELLKERQFAIDWYASHRTEDHYDNSYQLTSYDHPLYGPICYLITETIITTARGNLCLFIYNACDETTASVFRKLFKQSGARIHRLASWPHKRIQTA